VNFDWQHLLVIYNILLQKSNRNTDINHIYCLLEDSGPIETFLETFLKLLVCRFCIVISSKISALEEYYKQSFEDTYDKLDYTIPCKYMLVLADANK